MPMRTPRSCSRPATRWRSSLLSRGAEAMIRASVQADPIMPEVVLGHVGSDEDGASLLFLGVVRNHADGRSVSGMHYDAYQAIAEAVLHEIATEAAERLGTDRVSVVHRTGALGIGDV